MTAGRVRQLLARWSGVDVDADAPVAHLLDRFDLNRLPPDPVVFTARDEAALLGV